MFFVCLCFYFISITNFILLIKGEKYYILHLMKTDKYYFFIIILL